MRDIKIISTLLALASYTAHAAEEHHASSEGLNWWGLGSVYEHNPALGWQILTFLIFITIVYRMLKGPLALYLESRSRSIAQAINDSEEAKTASKKLLDSLNDKLKNVGQETAHIINEFKVQASKEEEAAQKQAQRLVNHIRTESEHAIKSEIIKAKHVLQTEFAHKIMHAAREEIAQGHLKNDDLVNNFSKELASNKL